MRKVILYIAMSMDGFIADKNKGVSWLEENVINNGEEGTYDKFYSSIDTVILGKNTYNQIITELSPDTWVYDDKISYVITSKQDNDKNNIFFRSDLCKLINELKSSEGKDIWICGGASIVNQLLKENLIDKITLSVIPVLLGDGIKLFERNNNITKFKLTSTCKYNGVIDLSYDKIVD